ncbi:MAG: hypothetical protein AAF639_14650 [Chloroflexota bacterium]
MQPTSHPEAKAVVAELKRRRLSVNMILGDQEGPTRQLAQELGSLFISRLSVGGVFGNTMLPMLKYGHHLGTKDEIS